MMSAHAVDMDDEDGRCLLDVICDPQALNDFLHGSDQLDGEDLLDTTTDPASAFFTDASLNVQDATVNHLNSGHTQGSSSAVDLDFLEDEILGPPSGSNLQNSEQPCDILQQSLQEANITEQSLEEDADLDIASLHFPSLQPASQSADGGQLFPAGADLIGLPQQPAPPPPVLAQQALIQPQALGGQVVNKAISLQPFLQQVGLGNVTLQPLPNGSPSGALGISQIQVVGQLSSQPLMAINQPGQQVIAKAGQPAQVGGVPGVSYISSPAPESQPPPQPGVALPSSGVSPPSAGLVLQKASGPATLNGNSLFAGASGGVTRPSPSPAVMQAQSVVVQRTPTPIQPKPSTGLVQHKLFQISSKPFTVQAEAPPSLQQQQQSHQPPQQPPPPPKAQQNLTFMASKPAQSVVFSASGAAFPQTIPSTVFKPQQTAQPAAFGKPLSLHVQGGSIVIQPQQVQQAMLQGQSQFLLQGQLPSGHSLSLPQSLPALQPSVGGQLLGAQPSATHIIANQTLPAHILSGQGLAGQLSLGQVIAAQGAHGATHILSAPIHLQPSPVGQPALFQMPVSLGSQSQASAPAVIQGVTLPGQAGAAASAVLGPGEAPVSAGAAQQGPGGLVALGNGQTSLLAVQAASAPTPPSHIQTLSQAGSSNSIALPVPAGKVVITQQGSGPAVGQDNAQVFFQQMAAGQQKTAMAQGTPTSQSPVPQAPQNDAQVHIQLPSPHQSRPPSQPQPLSRPPSRPQSRPPSQPQVLSRPPSEPLSRSCTPSQQPLYIIQTQLQGSPHGSSQPPHPMRPPSQPPLQAPFQGGGPPHPAEPQLTPPAPAPQQQQQPGGQGQTPAEAQTPPRLLPPSQSPGDPQPPPLQLQLHCQPHPQGPLQPVYQTLTLTAEQQQRFQMVTNQLQNMSAIPNPTQQHKSFMEKLQQMQHNIILQAKPSSSSQGVTGVSQLSSQVQSPSLQTQAHTNSSGLKPQPTGGGPAALATLLQQTSVLVKASSAGTTATTRSPDSKVISGAASGAPCLLQQGATVPLQMKPLTTHQVQPSLQTKPGVISSISGLNMNLSKGPIQIQLLGKGLTQLVPAASVPAHQMDSKLGGLKTATSLQTAKESVLLDRLRMDQDTVLQPDYKSPFRSYQDMVHRLLPYHLYQGTLPSVEEHRKVDEEFEAVSTQLLKRTQAMLHKYRMLLFEEARRLSPSAEMVMIDRMFIQEEKTSLSTDKQLAKEKPDEYVASSSRSHNLTTSSSPPLCTTTASLEAPRLPSVQSATPLHPTKLVIKHAGGSPSVSWARVPPPQDGDDDTLRARSRPPPIKTYEARSRIGLKLKIKQEAGLSKVVHNTALDPVHQPASSVTPGAECPAATARQMNGSLEHSSPSPTSANLCKLPPRRSPREGGTPLPSDRTAADPSPPPPVAPPKPEDSRREGPPRGEAPARSVIASCKPRTARGSRPETDSRKSRTHTHPPPPAVASAGAQPEELPGGKAADGMDGLAGVEGELVRGILKAEPPDGSWELALPPPKRTKSESLDMDNASFSSDSPQDDTLTEHLQSAIDSILNLRQPQSSLAQNPVSSPYHSSEINSSPFSPAPHPDSYLAPNRNGGLGARTYTR
ncbi:BRD4-interacting chromatin-remodeling complex-associated protein-like isoform X5 [Hypanus sabinus]|uniref:BRD4-interacting chromatin-remodeling complex-associated protein-like isoform X5 n=1 Tax=Hypanus sabinus TaxID=79690 RepID=UPI0028C4688B|nr:BRD4-interacting chromatin-remodeling complex-associated protein-like isoform X5 [Hypanus sabinus]